MYLPDNRWLVEQLVSIYYQHEWWHDSKMSKEEAYKYHEKLLTNGNIITYVDGLRVLGYVEVWRVTYEQFGRILCRAPFSSYLENVTGGYIAYVANTWISEGYRKTGVAKWLRNEFFKQNYGAKYFCGEARRKRTGLLKVFKKEDLKSKLFNTGEI